MSAKNIAVGSNVTSTQVSIIEQLRKQLSEAEESIKGSAGIQEKLDAAKAAVALYTTQLQPYSQARNRIVNLRNAIKSLETPTNRSNHGVTMTPEVRAKLSASHKKLWAAKRAAAAGQPVAVKA
jgi:hypothetical protein